MSTCHPTHVQFTVLRARNLISKGKGGNNDVFVTIHLGKEKYQTSTIKNALHPEWFEECDLPIPYLQAEIEVTLYHRGVLSDDFLGYASIPLWSNLNNLSPQGSQSQWVTLRGKPTNKAGSNSSLKNRGELEVKLTFHVKSKQELSPHHGLKKQRPNTIRSFALAFGDKFKFSRSRSLRENRKDPEGGGKLDKSFVAGADGTKNGTGLDDIPRSYHHLHQYNHHQPQQQQQQQQLQQRHHYVGRPPPPPPPAAPLPLPPVHFSALDINRIYWPIDEEISDGLTRSYSLSAAYIKSMSLDRQAISLATNSHAATTTTTSTASTTVPNRTNANNTNCANTRSKRDPDRSAFHDPRGSDRVSNHYHESGVSQLHSQSMYNLPGSRQSYGDLPLYRSSSSSTTTTTTAPPPYDPHPYPSNPTIQSKDDTDLYSIPRHHRRTVSDYQISHGYNKNSNTHANHSLQNSPNPAGLFQENNVTRDHSLPRPSQAVYESIKERTEPENSPSSSSLSSDDPESVPKPKSRTGKRFTRRDVPVMGSSGRDYAKISGLTAPLSVNINVTHSSSSSSRTLTNAAISSKVNSTTPTSSIIPSSSSSFVQQQHQQQQQQHQQQQQQQQQLLQQSISSTFSTRDSGIVEDRSSSQTNSHDGGSFTTPDGTLSSAGIPSTALPNQHPLLTSHEAFHQPSDYNYHYTQQQSHPPLSSSTNVTKPQRNSHFEDSANIARANSSGSIFYHVTSTRDIQFGGGMMAKEIKKQVSGHQLFGSRDVGVSIGGGVVGLGGPPELVVKKRTRGQRDRLRQMRQDNRRVTVQGLSNHHQASSSLYEDSLSEFSDSERNEVSENLVSAYKNMTKEELLRVTIQTKAQMIRKEKYIKDLENYIDDLLVRVMETTPRLLTRKGQHHQHRI